MHMKYAVKKTRMAKPLFRNFLLPLEKRKAIWAIYVWCRRTDEIMDSKEASKKSKEELSDNLNEWEENTKIYLKEISNLNWMQFF